MKFKKDTYVAVYVEWLDSVATKKVWHSFKEIYEDHKEQTDHFKTIAFLILENKTEYIFCSSIHYEENDAVTAGNIFKIPKGCVTKMSKLK